MRDIVYLKGDATRPEHEGLKLVIHCCNDIGKWGKGFVVALSRRWKEPETQYKKLRHRKLGNVQLVPVTKEITVVNMIGQHGIYSDHNIPPIRYSAIRECLKRVYTFAKEKNATVHCPRFGTGLAGGRWSKIEEHIINELSKRDISVFVYNFIPKRKSYRNHFRGRYEGNGNNR